MFHIWGAMGQWQIVTVVTRNVKEFGKSKFK